MVELVELSNRQIVKWWNGRVVDPSRGARWNGGVGGVVESSNDGMVEVGSVESSKGGMLEWWSWLSC